MTSLVLDTCTAPCLDLILEDIGKVLKVTRTIEREINLTGYIYPCWSFKYDEGVHKAKGANQARKNKVLHLLSHFEIHSTIK